MSAPAPDHPTAPSLVATPADETTPPTAAPASDIRTPRGWLPIAAGAIAVLACLVGFGLIADEVREREAVALDDLLTPLLHSIATPGLDQVMTGVTTLGSTQVVLPLLVVVIVGLLWRNHRREAAFLVVAVAGSVLIDEVLKLVFHRPRPQLTWSQVQPEYSFPSGHAMNSLVLWVSLGIVVGVLAGRRAGIVAVVGAVILALAIGTSRIYLGYHYFTDVVGGLLAGAAWLLIVVTAFGGLSWVRAARVGARA